MFKFRKNVTDPPEEKKREVKQGSRQDGALALGRTLGQVSKSYKELLDAWKMLVEQMNMKTTDRLAQLIERDLQEGGMPLQTQQAQQTNPAENTEIVAELAELLAAQSTKYTRQIMQRDVEQQEQFDSMMNTIKTLTEQQVTTPMRQERAALEQERNETTKEYNRMQRELELTRQRMERERQELEQLQNTLSRDRNSMEQERIRLELQRKQQQNVGTTTEPVTESTPIRGGSKK